MANTTVKWPYELYGLQIPEGWKGLADPIMSYIDQYNRNRGEKQQIKLRQMTKRHGALRTFVSFAPEPLLTLIDEAEEKSQSICECCGITETVGKFTDSGVSMVMCKECAVRYCRKNGNEVVWKCEDPEVPVCFITGKGAISTRS